MKKNKREVILGIPPEELTQEISLFSKYRDTFTVHKSAKNGKSSFQITKSLLESLIETSMQIQKKPTLIITIMAGSDEYILTCSLTKNKVS